MKVNELMIHDCVLDGKSIVEVKSLSVLGGDVVGTLAPFSSIERYYADNTVANSQGARSLDQLNPIPITEKILEKNGFERDMHVSDTKPFDLDEDGYAYYQVGELDSSKPHIWGWYKDGVLELPNNCTMYIKIQYIHELQHVLRLFGFKDLADDFKV